MRFWQKIFLSSMILFTIAFDIGAYILITDSFKQSIDREVNSSVREEAVIASSLQSSISNMEQFLSGSEINESVLYTFIKPLAEYYQGQLVTIWLCDNGNEVYGNIPGKKLDWRKELGEKEQMVESRTIDGRRHMVVVACIPDYRNLILVYAKDIDEIDQSRRESIHVFILVSTGVVLVFGGIIYILLRRFTSPIDELVRKTSKIANGEYT